MKNTLSFSILRPSFSNYHVFIFSGLSVPASAPSERSGRADLLPLEKTQEGGVATRGPRPDSPAPSHAPYPHFSSCYPEHTRIHGKTLGSQEKRTINIESLRILIKL